MKRWATGKFLCVLVLTCCLACQETTTEETDEVVGGNSEVVDTLAAIPEVETVLAITGRLPLRRRTNGKLRARREVVIKSLTGGLLTEAPTEGQYYKDGELILATDDRAAQLAVARAEAARAEADFRNRDLLLQLTTNLPSGDSLVSELARENLLIQSGLPSAEVALQEARYQLSLTDLAAPFTGQAADVKVQVGQVIARGEEICTLVDLGSLEVEFSLLEQELGAELERYAVFVSPIAQPQLRLSATLDRINPIVEEDGLLRVRARLRSTGRQRLYPGMNVLVELESKAAAAVLVPKSAVVTRSERTLVFTLDTVSQRAQWKYVTVGAENDTQVAIGEGIEAGELVIVAGNLTLDHDVPVRIASKK